MRPERGLSTIQHCLQWYKFVLICTPAVQYPIHTGWLIKKWNMHGLRRSSNWTVVKTSLTSAVTCGHGKHSVQAVHQYDRPSLQRSTLIGSETVRLLDLRQACYVHFYAPPCRTRKHSTEYKAPLRPTIHAL